MTDPETTVVLHDRPLSPSLTTIAAERRIVLGWDITYSAVGGQDRLRDVNRFFSSVQWIGTVSILKIFRVNVYRLVIIFCIKLITDSTRQKTTSKSTIS